MYKQKSNAYALLWFSWWREKESNLRPPGYGPGKLPLLYPAINIAILYSCTIISHEFLKRKAFL